MKDNTSITLKITTMWKNGIPISKEAPKWNNFELKIEAFSLLKLKSIPIEVEFEERKSGEGVLQRGADWRH